MPLETLSRVKQLSALICLDSLLLVLEFLTVAAADAMTIVAPTDTAALIQ